MASRQSSLPIAVGSWPERTAARSGRTDAKDQKTRPFHAKRPPRRTGGPRSPGGSPLPGLEPLGTGLWKWRASTSAHPPPACWEDVCARSICVSGTGVCPPLMHMCSCPPRLWNHPLPPPRLGNSAVGPKTTADGTQVWNLGTFKYRGSRLWRMVPWVAEIDSRISECWGSCQSTQHPYLHKAGSPKSCGYLFPLKGRLGLTNHLEVQLALEKVPGGWFPFQHSSPPRGHVIRIQALGNWHVLMTVAKSRGLATIISS